MKPCFRIFVIGLCFLACPMSAFADAGTPLMWAGLLHLTIGNTLIGILEGFLIAWAFDLPRKRAVLIMIPANYFSAWLGGFFLTHTIANSLHMDLNNGWRWFWIMVLLTYVITVLLEWPFVALCFRRTENWLAKSLRANLLAQTTSYVLLFGWYWMASGTTLYTQLRVSSPQELALPGNVAVYFISEQDGNVYKQSVGGASQTRIYDLHSTNSGDRLFTRSAQSNGCWNLVARIETGDRKPRYVELSTNLVVEAAVDERPTLSSEYPDTWFNFGKAQSLGTAANGRWQFRTGFWAIGGLAAGNQITHQKIRFAFETPFAAWSIRNAVHLPSDKVLFQLGDNQICAFDPESRKIALLWHGRGPVAVIENSELISSDHHQEAQTPK